MNDLVSNIICREHGPFAAIAKDHLAGEGCPKCDGIPTYRAMISGIEQNISWKHSQRDEVMK